MRSVAKAIVVLSITDRSCGCINQTTSSLSQPNKPSGSSLSYTKSLTGCYPRTEELYRLEAFRAPQRESHSLYIVIPLAFGHLPDDAQIQENTSGMVQVAPGTSGSLISDHNERAIVVYGGRVACYLLDTRALGLPSLVCGQIRFQLGKQIFSSRCHATYRIYLLLFQIYPKATSVTREHFTLFGFMQRLLLFEKQLF